MKILFDQGTPAPLRRFLSNHSVQTAYEKGWSTLQNGDLIQAAENDGFEVFVTTDRNLKYQQNFTGRKIAIVVLTSTSWPRIQVKAPEISSLVDSVNSESYIEVVI